MSLAKCRFQRFDNADAGRLACQGAKRLTEQFGGFMPERCDQIACRNRLGKAS